MFENLSKKITSFFIKKNIITKDKEEMCNYSVFCRLSTLFTSFSIIFIGYISIGVLNAAIFTLTFLSIRKNSGGYHANTSAKCYVLSILIAIVNFYILFPALVKLSYQIGSSLLFVSIFVLLIFAPINHPNMDISLDELTANKKKMIYKLMVAFFIILLLFVIGKWENIITIIILGIATSAGSVIIAKIFKQEVKI